MLLRPRTGSRHRLEQAAAERGQRVLDAAHRAGVAHAVDQAVAFQRAQRLGERLRGDAPVRPALARTATALERPRLWQLMVTTMPSYQDYQNATRREIPVVVVSRI